MTTYTLKGIEIGDSVENSKLKIVVPEDFDRMRWKLVGPEEERTGDLDYFNKKGKKLEDATNFFLDGDEFYDLPGDPQVGMVEIGEGAFKGVVLMVLGLDGFGTQWWYQIGGPDADLTSLTGINLIVSIGQIGSDGLQLPDGKYKPGKKLDLEDLTSVKVSENDKIEGTSSKDRLEGGDGNDNIKGRGGNDRLYGNDDKDKLFGGNGDDRLKGGSKSDRLDGEKGDDILDGGSGGDEFVFRENGDKDTIKDFEDNKDEIWLDEDLWKGDLSRSKVVKKYADEKNGDVVFNFGSGDKLTVENVDDAGDLVNDIVFI